MRIRLNIEYGKRALEPAECDVFESCLLEPRSPWKSLMFSAALHCLLVPILPAFIEHLPSVGWVEPERPVSVARPIVLQLPERVYLPYSRPRPVPAVKQTAHSTAPPVPAVARSNAEEESGYRTYANRRFELPVQRVPSRAEQTLLQPNISLTQDPQNLARLPHLMFWSAQLSTPPVPKPFVMPGRQIESSEVAPIAPPELAIPNHELRLSDMQIARSGILVPTPALPVPPASSASIRTFERSKIDERQALSMHRSEGDPANVLALNPRPAPPVSEVTVPSVSQVGQLPSTTYGVKEGTSESGSGEELKPEQTRVSAAGAPKPSTPGREVEAVMESVSHGHPQILEASKESPAQTDRTVPAPVRMVHPENGVFDVVLIQASADTEMLPGPVLSGRPVHTVYLQVGAPREWILQYCVPQSSEYRVQQGGSVVQLGNPGPVKAPYPKVTVLPPAPALPRTARMVLHGFLTEQGMLRDLRMIGEDQKHGEAQIIPYLQQWEFRPAARDGRAIEVEVVLTIPVPKA